MKGTEGAKIIDELRPCDDERTEDKGKAVSTATGEYVIPKRTYSVNYYWFAY